MNLKKIKQNLEGLLLTCMAGHYQSVTMSVSANNAIMGCKQEYEVNTTHLRKLCKLKWNKSTGQSDQIQLISVNNKKR